MSGWQRVALKYLTTFVNRGSAPEYADDDDDGIPVINQACIPGDGRVDMSALKWQVPVRDPARLRGWLIERDVLVNSTGTGTLGRVAYFQGPSGCIADGHVTIVRTSPDALDARFLAYLLRTSWFYEYANAALAVGATNQIELNRDALRPLRLAVPGVVEQRAIADFLDAETARIDALVEKRAWMIVLVEARAATLVDQIVWSTDGRHVPLYRLTPDSRPIMYGIVLPGPDVDEGVPIVKGGDIGARRLDPSLLCRTTFEVEAPYARARLAPGDVLFAIRGSIGDAAVVPESLRGANITQDVARVSPRAGVDSRWLLYAVRSCRFFAQVDARATGATIRGVNIWDLKRAMIPLPPEREQRQLVDTLDRELDFADRTIAALERQIGFLQERKQALITATVTGQLDVTKGAT